MYGGGNMPSILDLLLLRSPLAICPSSPLTQLTSATGWRTSSAATELIAGHDKRARHTLDTGVSVLEIITLGKQAQGAAAGRGRAT